MQDGEEQTLEGIVETVTFHNNENGFTVLQLNVGGELVTAVGTFFEIGAGEEIVLHGRWSSHALFGRQFRTESYETRLPDNAADSGISDVSGRSDDAREARYSITVGTIMDFSSAPNTAATPSIFSISVFFICA